MQNRPSRFLIRVWMPLLALNLLFGNSSAQADQRVYDAGQLPNDRRLENPKDLNGYFPFLVPEGKAAWEERSAALRRRVKIATGLWPMPEKTPLNAVIHGRVERPGFTVEKVYFESVPNHFVTGLLFRPADGKNDVRRPGVLCPHGHGGRLQDYGAAKMANLIAQGAEKFEKSGRFPKLARCAHLARMGCVVFIFDMLGYADSGQITFQLAHRFADQRPEMEGKESWGLYSAQAELRLQSIMGIQTWNSVRCLDFLEELPDVDPKRLAVTGGSGGGTQTILLCAIDPRPVVAFPNGMVSTSMQGGCTCENCTLLRVGSGNVELAGLFAPRPQAMTAVNDWTKEMMTKGYPELQKLYAMVGRKDDVFCREMLHFPHNYNYQSRLTMYRWFNRYLDLGFDEAKIDEEDYEPLTAEEYTVWNKEHPKPEGGDEYELSLTKYLAEKSDQQIESLVPTNRADLDRFREVIGGAFASIIGRGLPAADDIKRTKVDKQTRNGYLYFEDILRLDSQGEEFPSVSLFPMNTKWNGDVGGASIVAPDLFGQGEFLPGDQPVKKQRTVKNPREAAAYTFGYNDTLFVRRVHDVLTLVSWIRNDEHEPKRLSLLGVNGAGPVAAAARAIARAAIDRLAIDTRAFRFADLTDYRDPDFVPGAVKYGDLPAVLALSSPDPLWIGGEQGQIPSTTLRTYRASGARESLVSSAQQNVSDAAVNWLLAR